MSKYIDYEFSKLCDEIDFWKEKADFWKNEYEKKNKEYNDLLYSSLKHNQVIMTNTVDILLNPEKYAGS